MGQHPRLVKGVINGAISGALWGLLFIIPQILHDFSPLQIATSRYLVYGAIAAALLWPRRAQLRKQLTRKDWWVLVQLGIYGNIVYYILLSIGVQYAGTAPTSLIIGLIPVTVTLIGSREDKSVSLKALAAPVLLCVVGVLLVGMNSLAGDGEIPGATAKAAWGLLAATGSMISWTIYSVKNSHWLMRRPDLSAMDGALLIGIMAGLFSLVLAPAAFLMGSGDVEHRPVDWGRFWFVGLMAGVLCSVFANNYWNKAARQLPMTLIGQMIVFETLFALLYAFIWEQRLPTLLEIGAIFALLGGVLWCARLHSQARQTAMGAATAE